MARAPIRVLVVDDDFRVAALHASIVDAVIGFETVARAGTIAQAREAVATAGEVDLALVDVHLPDGSGIELIRELRCDAFVVTAEDSATALRHAVTAARLAASAPPRNFTRRLWDNGAAGPLRLLSFPGPAATLPTC